MSSGFYLEDIINFDDLATWIKDHILKTIEDTGYDVEFVEPGEDLKETIKDIIEEKYPDKLAEEGWDGQGLVSTDTVDMFHEVFRNYNLSLYTNWLELNHYELEKNALFSKMKPEEALEELKEKYTQDRKVRVGVSEYELRPGIEFTTEKKIDQIVRGINLRLLRVLEKIGREVTYERKLLKLDLDGLLSEKEIYDRLENIIKDVIKLEEDFEDIKTNIDKLNMDNFDSSKYI